MTTTQSFIGVKLVQAKEMNRGDYNTYRCWTMPDNENAEDNGYLVVYPDGYESWCPKKQFEEANRPCDAMTFGHAIEAMKAGMKVARAGWNGKSMYLWLLPAAKVKKAWCKDPFMLEVCGNREEFDCLGAIRMKTATGEVLTGWLASQSDMLAEDWMIVGAE